MAASGSGLVALSALSLTLLWPDRFPRADRYGAFVVGLIVIATAMTDDDWRARNANGRGKPAMHDPNAVLAIKNLIQITAPRFAIVQSRPVTSSRS